VPGTSLLAQLLSVFEVFWANAVTGITAHNPAELVQLDTAALRSSASACQGKRTAPKT